MLITTTAHTTECYQSAIISNTVAIPAAIDWVSVGPCVVTPKD